MARHGRCAVFAPPNLPGAKSLDGLPEIEDEGVEGVEGIVGKAQVEPRPPIPAARALLAAVGVSTRSAASPFWAWAEGRQVGVWRLGISVPYPVGRLSGRPA